MPSLAGRSLLVILLLPENDYEWAATGRFGLFALPTTNSN